MSCYFRHLKDILSEAGIEVTPANKKQIDQAIHKIVGVAYKDCRNAWKKLKQDIMSDKKKQQGFIRKLQAALG